MTARAGPGPQEGERIRVGFRVSVRFRVRVTGKKANALANEHACLLHAHPDTLTLPSLTLTLPSSPPLGENGKKLLNCTRDEFMNMIYKHVLNKS